MTDEHGNFTENGQYFMVRCPECKRENWVMAVAYGKCAWCGCDGNPPTLDQELDDFVVEHIPQQA